MIATIITIAALIAASVTGYLAYTYKNEAADSNAKFQSTKEFAESSASKIVRLEADNKSMANKIILLTHELEAAKRVEAPKATKTTKKPSKAKKSNA